MKDYDKNKGSSYLKYQDAHNLYAWEMSQKFPVNQVRWVEDISEFDEMKALWKVVMKKGMKGISLKLIFNTQNIYKTFTMIYQFYLRELKCEKLVVSLHDKTEHVIYIRNLKQALSHRLVINRVIKFNQKSWLEPYIEMKTDLRRVANMVLNEIFTI